MSFPLVFFAVWDICIIFAATDIFTVMIKKRLFLHQDAILKRNGLIGLLLAFCALTMAQEKRVYLFPDFVKTMIKYKGSSKFLVMANYDAANQKVMYKQGDQLMELVSPQLVDTIYFGGQKWVYHQSEFCQVAAGKRDTILIGWHITKVHEGYVGAYGTSQVPSQKVQLGDHFGMGGLAGAGGGMYNGSFGVNDDDGEGRNLDVWKNKNENNYYFRKQGKEYKVSNLKSVYKTFPAQKDKIKEFVTTNKLDMMSAEKAVQIIHFCEDM